MKGLIAFGAIICFMLGFTTAISMQETNWLGHLVHGIWSEPNPGIYPKQSEYVPVVDGSIIIGLREDGVVVWKKAEEAEE